MHNPISREAVRVDPERLTGGRPCAYAACLAAARTVPMLYTGLCYTALMCAAYSR
ncbi:hypothetical protein PABY_07740 [Pyrodictium abyssi]|uniref:Uncharacterized protein n=1 Tax=Pyrodictium abyssi TaxID=54256 RepID=A0ABM8IUJ0_9CREN|nr:hypothetical protein PABY_07740 [Pyrodictium abyssi]